MISLNPTHVIAERMVRQGFARPLTDAEEFVELFRLLQPVSPAHMSMPGSAPSLVGRTAFDAIAEADRLRAWGTLVKGRFLGSNIGYVLADELDVYANAFRTSPARLTAQQEMILGVLREHGPMTPRRIKDETGLLNKQIMPALHRMQKAFLVFEDQSDGDWGRDWSAFESEWPEVRLDESERLGALVQVLLRFLRSHVFATEAQIADWSQLSAKKHIGTALGEMESAGLILRAEAGDLGEGWACAEDAELPAAEPPRHTVMLDKADPLVRSHMGELKHLFAGEEVLQYLLIDGRLQGAVCGHWRIGPHSVDDVLLLLPKEERLARRREILEEVAKVYRPPDSGILHYDGAIAEGYS